MIAKDIMIGDWVMCTYPTINRPSRVKEIKSLYDGEIRVVIYDETRLAIALKNIEPIPLTPDILLANGFTSIPDLFGFLSADGRISLDPSVPNYPRKWHAHIDNEDFQSIASCDLDYLHQLQHLLRICGIEINWQL